MNIRDYTTIEERRNALEKELGFPFPSIGSHMLEKTGASEKNCENMIGSIQVPLGIAGPLNIIITNKEEGIRKKELESKTYDLRTRFDREARRAKTYFIPLATTEGALVASVNRGCKAITESGGAMVRVETIGVTRGPVFSVKTEKERGALETYLKTETATIKKIAEQTSSHLTFLRYETFFTRPYEFVRFYFDTGDAMGMNMVTIASQAIADHFHKKLGIRCIALSGNFCADKKPSLSNFRNGRGKKVTAEVRVPGSVLQTVLKTTAEKFFEVWQAKCIAGSEATGMIGGNAQVANIVAALFLATGQDIAHVTEGSMAQTTTEYTPDRDGVVVSVVMPDVMVGTVGGGTGLPTQKECLEILGVSGGHDGANARTLAGIIGAGALAGEVSLIASLSEGSLGKAHERLGRGRK